jgi:hypothetical protein
LTHVLFAKFGPHRNVCRVPFLYKMTHSLFEHFGRRRVSLFSSPVHVNLTAELETLMRLPILELLKLPNAYKKAIT